MLGLPAAFGVARLLSAALYDVPAADPLAWGGAVAVLLIVGTLANLVPARRAAALSPSTALRVE
jgi:ABC-type antimicrobial peptide transport system permease subunit